MTWQNVGENRWDWTADDNRHLLLYGPDTGILAELHDQWLHKYKAPADLAEQPLDGAWHYETTELTDLVTSDEQAWTILAAAVQDIST